MRKKKSLLPKGRMKTTVQEKMEKMKEKTES